MVESQEQDKIPIKIAASFIGVSPYTLRAWVMERRLPFFRCGRRIVFSRDDLKEFLKNCRVTPREEGR